MNITELTNQSLKDLHKSIREALAKDDVTPNGDPMSYGFHEYSDWRKLVDEIEKVLGERKIKFMPIDW